MNLTLIAPVRVHDSRITGGPISGPIEPDEVVRVPIRGVGGIPTAATVVAFTIHILEPEEAGRLTVWGGDFPAPAGSTLVYVAGAIGSGSGIASLVGGTYDIGVFSTARTHFLLDVHGYSED